MSRLTCRIRYGSYGRGSIRGSLSLLDADVGGVNLRPVVVINFTVDLECVFVNGCDSRGMVRSPTAKINSIKRIDAGGHFAANRATPLGLRGRNLRRGGWHEFEFVNVLTSFLAQMRGCF